MNSLSSSDVTATAAHEQPPQFGWYSYCCTWTASAVRMLQLLLHMNSLSSSDVTATAAHEQSPQFGCYSYCCTWTVSAVRMIQLLLHMSSLRSSDDTAAAAHEQSPQFGWYSNVAHEQSPQFGWYSNVAHEQPPQFGWYSNAAHEQILLHTKSALYKWYSHCAIQNSLRSSDGRATVSREVSTADIVQPLYSIETFIVHRVGLSLRINSLHSRACTATIAQEVSVIISSLFCLSTACFLMTRFL
jgi:hypothetical protein